MGRWGYRRGVGVFDMSCWLIDWVGGRVAFIYSFAFGGMWWVGEWVKWVKGGLVVTLPHFTSLYFTSLHSWLLGTLE